MDIDRLFALGFELGDQAVGGESQGAWYATAPDGMPVMLKWSADETLVERYAVLLPALDQLRDRGVPVPEYPYVFEHDGGTLSAQQILSGRSEDNPAPAIVEAMIECIAAKAGLAGPAPAAEPPTWGAFVVRALTVGLGRWAVHESLRSSGARSSAVLERLEAVGAVADPSWFPSDGLVHLDLHTDNVLIGDDGTLTGIIDWEGACSGDHRFDLVAYAFDLDGHDQSTWDLVDRAGIDRRVLRAYVALLVLKGTDWAIRYRPHDVERQLDRAERVFDRYDL